MSASASSTKKPKTDSIAIHVGTSFGDDDSPTQAVLRLSLATDTGLLTNSGDPIPIADHTNPGWLSRYTTTTTGNDQKTLVYIAMEDDPGMLRAYKVTDGNGLVPHGNAVSAVGRNPCYCQLDISGKWLFAANYTEGSVSVVPVRDDGRLGPATDSKKHQGPLQDDLQDRQEAPHAHSILPHPTNRYVVACDLGLSKVFCYKFDATKGALQGAADDPGHLTLAPDAGCRHCCWDATGETLFIVNELNYTLTVAAFDVDTGSLTEVCSVYLLRDGDKADRAHHRGGSDIAIHPNGRFLYVGCRCTTPGLIAILKVQGKGSSCEAKVVGHESTRGDVPRNFKLLQNGHWLVVGNQEGKSVVSFAVNQDTGFLEFKNEISTAPYKACNIASPDAIYA